MGRARSITGYTETHTGLCSARLPLRSNTDSSIYTRFYANNELNVSKIFRMNAPAKTVYSEDVPFTMIWSPRKFWELAVGWAACLNLHRLGAFFKVLRTI